jgi:mRNA interferase RelE/StbE
VSYEVIWEPEALAQAERFAKDDPDGVRQVNRIVVPSPFTE